MKQTRLDIGKKWWSIRRRIVIVVLVFLMCISTFFTLMYLKKQTDLVDHRVYTQAVEQLVNQSLLQYDSKDNETVKEGNFNLNRYFMVYQESENRHLVDQLETQTKQVTKNLQDTHAVVVSYIDEEHVNEYVIHRNLVSKEYRWHEHEQHFSMEKEEVTIAEVLLSSSREMATLKDIVRDEASILAIHRVMQAEVLQQSKKSSEIIKDVLEMPKLHFASDVNVLPTSLQIAIDKKVFGISAVNIEFDSIYPFIAPQFLSEVSKEEKEKEEGKKYIALTFDDGPNSTSTVDLLKILAKEKVQATFFLLGQMVESHPDIAKKIAQEGHEIANHSYSHPDLTTLSAEQVRAEVLKTDEAIYRATGVLTKNFRPPYGAVNPDVIKEVGLPIIQWDVDSLDWQLRDPQAIATRVIDAANEGSIILLHDIHKTSVASVSKIIYKLKQEGYLFVTISELLSHAQKPGFQYFDGNDR